jgi:hypothetical protein
MIRPTRLGAAASIAALGVSLASPVLAGASAATHPSSQLTAALTATHARAAVKSHDGALSAVAAELDAIAATPGVAGTPAATTLTTLATALSNPLGVSPTELTSAISSLNGLSASLPAPLNMLLAELTSTLTTNPASLLLGTIPTLSPTDLSSLLAELTMLGSLPAGQQSSSLPGLAALLEQLGATAPLAGTAAQTTLDDLADAIATNPVTSSELATIAATLDGVAGSLPSPLNGTVSSLGGQLSSDASGTGTSGSPGSSGTSGSSGSSGSSGTSGTSGTSGGAGSSGTGSTGAAGASGSSGSASGTTNSGTPSSSGTPATTKPFHASGLFRKDQRTLHATTVTLYCSATPGYVCMDTIKVTEKGYHAYTKHVHFRAGRTDRWTIVLKPIKTAHKTKATQVKPATKRPVMKINITSLNYKVTKILQ